MTQKSDRLHSSCTSYIRKSVFSSQAVSASLITFRLLSNQYILCVREVTIFCHFHELFDVLS